VGEARRLRAGDGRDLVVQLVAADLVVDDGEDDTRVDAVGGVRAERTRERRGEGGLDAVEVDPAGGDPAEDGGCGPPAERRAPRRREREHGGPGPPVARRGRLRAGEHLGVEVAGRARDEAGLGQALVVDDLGDAEVDEHRAGAREHDVAGLEVAVDDALGVDGTQRARQAVGQHDDLLGAERPVLADVLLEGRTVDELRDDEGLLVLHLGVDDAGDPRVAHAVQEGDLAGQAGAGGGVAGDVRVQELERDAVAVAVERLVDLAHATGADDAQEPVPADFPGRQGGAGRRSRQGRAGDRSGRMTRGHRVGRRDRRPLADRELLGRVPGHAGARAGRRGPVHSRLGTHAPRLSGPGVTRRAARRPALPRARAGRDPTGGVGRAFFAAAT
jgi:hypothetical protein